MNTITNSFSLKNYSDKQIKIFAGFMILLTFVFLILIPNVSANGIGDFPYNCAERIVGGINEALSTALSGDWEQAILEADLLATVQDAVIGFGIVLMIFYTFTKMFTTLTSGQDPVEVVIRSIAEIFIGYLFVVNMPDILTALETFGRDVVAEITSTAEEGPDMLTAEDLLEIVTGDTSGGWLWGVKATMMLIFPWMLSYVMEIVAYILGISLLFELGIRKVFSPLAAADICGEGLRSPGVRYMKRYLAVFLKIAICHVVAYINIILLSVAADPPSTEGPMSSAFGYVAIIIAANFAAIGVMMKGGEYANDIVGS